MVNFIVGCRGYGESDHPSGRSQYKLSLLVKDIKEIVSHLECLINLKC